MSVLLLSLVTSQLRSSKLRVAVLVLLTAVVVMLQAVTSQLAASNDRQLEQAIENSVGVPGVVLVGLDGQLPPTSGEDIIELIDRYVVALNGSAAIAFYQWDESFDCPGSPPGDPSVALGVAAMKFGDPDVLARIGQEVSDLPGREYCLGDLRGGSDWVVGGIRVGNVRYGLLRPDLLRAARLQGDGPRLHIIAVTGNENVDDASYQAKAVAQQVFGPTFVEAGLAWPGVTTDAIGRNELHDAGTLTSRVLRTIGWGFTAAAGTAMLAAQSMSSRTRRWFNALCRSIGARRWQLLFVLVGEVALLALTGFVVAVGALAMLRSPLRSAAEGLGYDAPPTFLQLEPIVNGIGALAAIALLAAAVPVWAALREDPIAALEGSAGAG